MSARRVLIGAALIVSTAACGGNGGDTTTSASVIESTAGTTAPPAPTATTTSPAGTATTTSPPSSTAAAPPSTSTTTSTLTPATVAPTTTVETNPIFKITVSNGEVKGPERVDVRLGDVFIVRVVADVVDEVHIHGYDRLADVAPGLPAVIEVDAIIPGVFEVELEGSALELLIIEVA